MSALTFNIARSRGSGCRRRYRAGMMVIDRRATGSTGRNAAPSLTRGIYGSDAGSHRVASPSPSRGVARRLIYAENTTGLIADRPPAANLSRRPAGVYSSVITQSLPTSLRRRRPRSPRSSGCTNNIHATSWREACSSSSSIRYYKVYITQAQTHSPQDPAL